MMASGGSIPEAPAPLSPAGGNPAPDDLGRRADMFRYWAFISYSHEDTRWGEWLHRALETYRVPKTLIGRRSAGESVPARLTPIFRDRDELPTSGELGDELRLALRRSRFLIVVCSPSAARSRWVNEEVRLFKSLMPENQGRVLCLIVAGEPNAAGKLKNVEECLPPAVRFRVDAEGRLTEQPSDPVAADAREGRDGRTSAMLRIAAGILGIGYDELRQRERRRTRRHRRRVAAAISAVVLLLAALYLGGSDAGWGLPGGEHVRTWLDRRGASVFRPVPSDAIVRAAAASQRRQLFAAYAQRQSAAGWMPRTLGPTTGADYAEVWSHTQTIAASFRLPDASAEELRRLVPSLALPFQPPHAPMERNGVMYGWVPFQEKDDVTAAPPALWTAIMLATAMARENVLTETERMRCEAWLMTTQQVLRTYRPPGVPGAWTMFPLQTDPAQADAYTAVLALTALLDTRRAGLPWDGSMESRDALLSATAQWLIQRYQPSGEMAGWQGVAGSRGIIFEGLTVQIYATLLRAESEAGIALPAVMLAQMHRLLVRYAEISVDHPIQSAEFNSDSFLNHEGARVRGGDTVNFLWYPWAIECCVRWLDRAARVGAPAEEVFRIRRTLGHLVVDLGDEYVRRALTTWSFVAAEDLYCLANVPPP